MSPWVSAVTNKSLIVVSSYEVLQKEVDCFASLSISKMGTSAVVLGGSKGSWYLLALLNKQTLMSDSEGNKSQEGASIQMAGIT